MVLKTRNHVKTTPDARRIILATVHELPAISALGDGYSTANLTAMA
jgi:hypothetical protein